MIGWLVAGAAVLVGVPAAMYWAQDSLLFLPHFAAPPPDPARAPRPVEPIELRTADGVVLRGWFSPGRANPAPLVLYFGGNAENVGWQVHEPWPGDWSLALVNYRGYGTSEGRPSETALIADAEALLAQFSARADVDATRIVLVGRSLGSGVATQLAARAQVAGVILVAPYDSMVALAGHHYPFVPARWLLKHPFDTVARAPSVRAPLLAIVGARDTIIPNEHSRRLYDAWGGPKTWVEIAAADHNGLGAQPEFWGAVREFLARVRAG